MSMEQNKRHIRQSIKENQQQEFYSYFTQLSDHAQFENWTLERTVEVCENFNNKIQTIKIQVLPKETTINCPKDQLEKIINEVTVLPPQKVGIPREEQKKYSSLMLLQEIQIQTSIKKNLSSKKNIQKKDENWLNIANLSQFLTNNTTPFKPETDLFQSFDTLLTKVNIEPKKNEATIVQQLMEKTQVPNRRSIKQVNDSFTVPIKETKDKSRQKDRIFKWKIKQVINCQKIEQKIVKYKISIKQHEMVHRIFLPDYAIYSLQVMPNNVICKRTYNDFVTLKERLAIIYPFAKLPFLESSSWLSENDLALINKNKYNLEIFMRGLLDHPLLSSSDILKSFITIAQHKQIKKYLEELQKANSPKILSQISNETGKLDIELTTDNYDLIRQLPKWEKMFEEYFEQYNDLLSNLSGQLELVQRTFGQCEKLSKQMYKCLKDLTDKNTEIEKQKKFQLFFKKQQEYLYSRKIQTQKEITNINEILLPFLRYQKANINLFKPYYEDVQNLTEKYLKRLDSQPQSPSSDQEIQTIVSKNKLRNGIWEQSQNILLFRLQLGFLHSQLMKQAHLYNNHLIKNLQGTWAHFIQRQKGNKIPMLRTLSA